MTTRERVYRTHALILRRRDHSDADRVLTIFTPNNGKQEVIAKGIRKPSSHKAGHLELFTHSSLLIAQGRTWDIVTEVVTVESFRHLRTDLDAIGRASLVCELIDAFTSSEDDNKPLWELSLHVLRSLDAAVTAPEECDRGVLTAWFELQLLSLTGFQPQLFHCIDCNTPLSPVTNFLSLHEGGVLCPNCAPSHRDVEALEPDVLKVLRYVQSHAWQEVGTLRVRPIIMRRVESVLTRYLIFVLERRLKSPDFLRKLESDARFSAEP